MRTFLNLTAFSPQMAFALCAFLERRDGEEQEEVVRAWLAPSTLFAGGRPPDDWGYAYALDVAAHLKLIERADGHLKLLAETGASLPRFRAEVRERLMQNAVHAFDDPEDPSDELTRALTWWSHQPPQVLTSATFEPLMQGLPFKPIRQPTRWVVFERWAIFLGFTWRLSEGLIPDPTAAVEEALDHVLPRETTLDMPEFIERLGVRLPVIDGGSAFVSYRKRIGSKAPADVLEAPLSLALLRLENRGEIGFPPLKDAAGVSIRCGAIDRRVARIRRPTLAALSSETK